MVEIARSHGREPAGKLKHLGMTELEGRGEIQFAGLALDGFDDAGAAVPGIAAPQARRAVEHGPAGHVVIVHVLSARDQPRPLLEGAVRGERHPEGFEIVGGWLPVARQRRLRLVHRFLLE
jgi:hypothetical protein